MRCVNWKNPGFEACFSVQPKLALTAPKNWASEWSLMAELVPYKS